MGKGLKNTIAIITIIIISVSLGYVCDRIIISLEKRSHPIRFEEPVGKYSRQYGVPEEIIYGVIKAESGFDSAAVSPKGAVGLMQITPDTFDWLTKYQIRENLSQGLLYDPETNIKYGVFFLSYLYREFENWDIAFAAYNAGLNRVKNNWLNNPEYIKDNEIVYIPIEETRNYVQRVKKNTETYKKLYFN
ncbi:MAG: lytic transglycosylase domain-containing protein [Oscillospiraceae bacterium]|nr:lytic transglycosylase domain-containing protein [Oscillospiraceae bacterium]